MRQKSSDRVMKNAQDEYLIKQRERELDEDITKVLIYLKEAKTFEATVTFKRLEEKLRHERRIVK